MLEKHFKSQELLEEKNVVKRENVIILNVTCVQFNIQTVNYFAF